MSQTHGTVPGTMISQNLRSLDKQRHPFPPFDNQLSTGLSSWMSSGLLYYTLTHTLIFQVSHKIFLKAALMTNLSHVQHKETTAQVAEC